MFRRLFAAPMAFLVITAAADAGGVLGIELIPNIDPMAAAGGESVTVNVNLTQTGGAEEVLRLLALDFSRSDAGIELQSWDWSYYGGPPCPSCPPRTGWADFGELPLVTTVSLAAGQDAFTSVFLPEDGTINLGRILVRLPEDLGNGVALDALNLPNDDLNAGTRIDIDFAQPRTIREFEGGTLTFVPEPATATLLVLAAAGAGIRPRRGKRSTRREESGL